MAEDGGRRAPRRREPWVSRAVDAGAVLTGWTLVLVVSDITMPWERTTAESLVLDAVATLTTLLMLERRGVHQDRPELPQTEQTARTLASIALGATAVALVAAIADLSIGARELLFGAAASGVLVAVARGYLRAWRSRSRRHTEGADAERVVVVGTGAEARELVQLMVEHPEANLVPLGVIGNLEVARRHGLEHLWLGATDEVTSLMRLHRATSAVVTATGFRGEQFRRVTRQVLACGFDVRITTGITRLHYGRFDVQSLMHEPLVSITSRHTAPWQERMKRAVDIVGASLALALAAPVLLATAVAIKVEDGGPVLFRQKRVGIAGGTFAMTKFRSMVCDAEARKAELAGHNERSGPLFKVTRDPRITRVGRIIRELSVDELPQLLDVLRGDMSLVGPRPALPEEHDAFDSELLDRFSVRPGITGLWQVEARSNASFNAYRRLDLHYVENWSLALDVKILLATAEQMLVVMATAPLRSLPFVGRVDGVRSPARPEDDGVVIDLRVVDDQVEDGTVAAIPAGTE